MFTWDTDARGFFNRLAARGLTEAMIHDEARRRKQLHITLMIVTSAAGAAGMN